MAAKVFESTGKFGLTLAVAEGLVNSALYNVDAVHRADIVIGEGTHFLIPWVQKPIIFDFITGSKDLQKVSITLHILFPPFASQLPCIFTSMAEDHDERVLLSIMTEILKSVVAGFDRELVSRQVSADTFGLILDDVPLTHLTFRKELTEAMEAKQVPRPADSISEF
uniref:Prohibitin n=1 Tax=Saimiri boliviensis boliviensis TaxID=39432 RepID=A0A2K6TFA6_SAIBB